MCRPGLKVQDGKLTLAIADGEDSASWTSTFDQVSSFSLVAPDLGTQAEVWRIAVGPIWHVEFSGLPETPNPSANNQPDYHVFEFHPLPGETLTMKVQKPNPSTGAIRAIDSLNLASAIGPRSRIHSLTMDMRASQGVSRPSACRRTWNCWASAATAKHWDCACSNAS